MLYCALLTVLAVVTHLIQVAPASAGSVEGVDEDPRFLHAIADVRMTYDPDFVLRPQAGHPYFTDVAAGETGPTLRWRAFGARPEAVGVAAVRSGATVVVVLGRAGALVARIPDAAARRTDGARGGMDRPRARAADAAAQQRAEASAARVLRPLDGALHERRSALLHRHHQQRAAMAAAAPPRTVAFIFTPRHARLDGPQAGQDLFIQRHGPAADGGWRARDAHLVQALESMLQNRLGVQARVRTQPRAVGGGGGGGAISVQFSGLDARPHVSYAPGREGRRSRRAAATIWAHGEQMYLDTWEVDA